MDLATRKIKFVEQFLKITTLEKVERLEALLSKVIDDKTEPVAYTMAGEPISAEQYVKNNEEAYQSVKNGDSISHEEMIKRYSQK